MGDFRYKGLASYNDLPHYIAEERYLLNLNGMLSLSLSLGHNLSVTVNYQ